MLSARELENLAREHWQKHLKQDYRKLVADKQDKMFFEKLGQEAFARQIQIEDQLMAAEIMPREFQEKLERVTQIGLQAKEIALQELILIPDSETAEAISQGGYRG